MKPQAKSLALTAQQRSVLRGMLIDRQSERARLHVQLRDENEPFSQARWDLLGREMTMLYKWLDEPYHKPEYATIGKGERDAFKAVCRAEYGKEAVASRKPLPQRKYLPRNDPAEAFGD